MSNDARPITIPDAESIRRILARQHSVCVLRGGESFVVLEDEEATGVFAWRVLGPPEEPAAASFGECELSEDDTPDYSEVSTRIAAWMAEAPTTETMHAS